MDFTAKHHRLLFALVLTVLLVPFAFAGDVRLGQENYVQVVLCKHQESAVQLGKVFVSGSKADVGEEVNMLFQKYQSVQECIVVQGPVLFNRVAERITKDGRSMNIYGVRIEGVKHEFFVPLARDPEST